MTFFRFRKYFTAMTVMVTLFFGMWISEGEALTCGLQQDVNKQLIDIFQEKPVAMGIVSEKVLMQIFVSNLGTWTISLTNTEGISCIVATGSNFQFQDYKLGPEA